MSAHPAEDLLAPGDYWACDQPERPTSTSTCFDLRCHRCRIAAQAMLAREGDTVGTSWDTGRTRRLDSVADALAAAEAEFAERAS